MGGVQETLAELNVTELTSTAVGALGATVAVAAVCAATTVESYDAPVVLAMTWKLYPVLGISPAIVTTVSLSGADCAQIPCPNAAYCTTYATGTVEATAVQLIDIVVEVGENAVIFVGPPLAKPSVLVDETGLVALPAVLNDITWKSYRVAGNRPETVVVKVLSRLAAQVVQFEVPVNRYCTVYENGLVPPSGGVQANGMAVAEAWPNCTPD